MIELNSLGWCDHFASQLELKSVVGRVVEEQREHFQVLTERGEIRVQIAGKLRHESSQSSDFPAVGDWVVLRDLQIIRILNRKSRFSRAAPEGGGEQIIAANVDIAFIVSAMGRDHNVRRIERYLSLVWESGAIPVVLLTKTDLCDDLEAVIRDVEAIAPGIRIIATSSVSHEGIDELASAVHAGQTAVIVGSSGTGKSTLVNQLMGSDVQYVSQVSGFKDKGRHTTTARRLLHLPGGGMIIDTPGMRELQLYEAEAGVSQAFDDIEQLVARCRFTDCRHGNEPGCAIRAALERGSLDQNRLRSYQKLQREAVYQMSQNDAHLRRQQRDEWKKRSRQGMENMKRKRGW